MSRFFVVPVPLDETNSGPCPPDRAVRTDWQVWDNFGLSDDDSFETQAEAIDWAMLCNEVHNSMHEDALS